MDKDTKIYGNVRLLNNGQTFAFLGVEGVAKEQLEITQPAHEKPSQLHYVIFYNEINRTVNGAEGAWMVIATQPQWYVQINTLAEQLVDPIKVLESTETLQLYVTNNRIYCAVHDDPEKVVGCINWKK